ncbi:hypothetical protein F2Q68_00034514 [Brassica cretica]|uniref:Uncharacterized protein n=1 Tax=Brassica cretica TaxID=69181 RepID=A0A8S9H6G8_BRACR|nr:hypothetical protein F2Q68_00034514 [Brassica cretica]KAF3490219.1 hypothetical protein F2Q69_00053304 [Brassica cretica]
MIDLRKNPRVPIWPQGSKDKFQEEVRTPVQPKAHRGHYNFKNLWVPVKRSPDPKPSAKAHQGHYIPKGPLGSHATSGSKYTRVPIRSLDLRNNPAFLRDLRDLVKDLRVSDRTFWSKGTSGSQTRCKDPRRASAPPPQPTDSQRTPWASQGLRIRKDLDIKTQIGKKAKRSG